jgi:hypothetical protein
VFHIIDRRPKIDASSAEGESPVKCSGHIQLDKVTFAYPQRTEASLTAWQPCRFPCTTLAAPKLRFGTRWAVHDDTRTPNRS